jgi:hypothetical protein
MPIDPTFNSITDPDRDYTPNTIWQLMPHQSTSYSEYIMIMSYDRVTRNAKLILLPTLDEEDYLVAKSNIIEVGDRKIRQLYIPREDLIIVKKKDKKFSRRNFMRGGKNVSGNGRGQAR